MLSDRSSKQKIVTMSSTEAELVGLSNSAAQAIHLRNFIMGQEYVLGPFAIFQDSLNYMAIVKCGGPGSERSRHINIRHFWVARRIDEGDVIVEYLGTEIMLANRPRKARSRSAV